MSMKEIYLLDFFVRVKVGYMACRMYEGAIHIFNGCVLWSSRERVKGEVAAPKKRTVPSKGMNPDRKVGSCKPRITNLSLRICMETYDDDTRYRKNIGNRYLKHPGHESQASRIFNWSSKVKNRIISFPM